MLKIFNTLTRKKEIFKPILKKKISIYVCGITVYDYCHIGHARTFIFFDVMNRYFMESGYCIKYVRNITDIDDKILQRSKLKKMNYKSFTKNMIQEMNFDFDSLGILKPSFEPMVTKNISEIISFITVLLKNKNAYIDSDGNVLFSIKSFKKYGELSRKNNQKKFFKETVQFLKNDFILWKKSLLGELFWDSPWGNGRPGWHIECSVIINKYFGKNLDIHGGGSDLIFPHHENENAQSKCFNQKKYVNYWVHTGMIIFKNKKMSKSFGNTFLIRDLRKNFSSDSIRYYFLSSKYRHPIYYNIKNLQESKKILKNFYFCLSLIDKRKFKFSLKNSSDKDINSFKRSMDDDFNTREALLVLLKLSKKIIYLYELKNFKKSTFLSEKLFYLGRILGLFFSQNKFKKNQRILKNDSFKFQKIEKLIKLREKARSLFLWNESDLLKKKLLKLGVYIEDQKDKTFWKFI